MGFLLSWFSQVAAVTWLNLRNLRQRVASSAATVVGVAGVVLVVVGVLSVALGLAATLSSTGDPSSVMVMRSGADSEMTSFLCFTAQSQLSRVQFVRWTRARRHRS